MRSPDSTSERSQTLEVEGDTAQALDLANLAISICEKVSQQGKACTQYLPNMLRHRATIETTLRQFAPAESDARQALQLLLQQARPGDFSQSTGKAYLALARCLAAEGRDAEARAMAQHAADQLEKSVGDRPSGHALRPGTGDERLTAACRLLRPQLTPSGA